MLESETEVEFQPSPFFNEQLTAFELWLQHGSNEKKPPEQLPIVLQVNPAVCLALSLSPSIHHIPAPCTTQFTHCMQI